MKLIIEINFLILILINITVVSKNYLLCNIIINGHRISKIFFTDVSETKTRKYIDTQFK